MPSSALRHPSPLFDGRPIGVYYLQIVECDQHIVKYRSSCDEPTLHPSIPLPDRRLDRDRTELWGAPAGGRDINLVLSRPVDSCPSLPHHQRQGALQRQQRGLLLHDLFVIILNQYADDGTLVLPVARRAPCSSVCTGKGISFWVSPWRMGKACRKPNSLAHGIGTPSSSNGAPVWAAAVDGGLFRAFVMSSARCASHQVP